MSLDTVNPTAIKPLTSHSSPTKPLLLVTDVLQQSVEGAYPRAGRPSWMAIVIDQALIASAVELSQTVRRTFQDLKIPVNGMCWAGKGGMAAPMQEPADRQPYLKVFEVRDRYFEKDEGGVQYIGDPWIQFEAHLRDENGNVLEIQSDAIHLQTLVNIHEHLQTHDVSSLDTEEKVWTQDLNALEWKFIQREGQAMQGLQESQEQQETQEPVTVLFSDRREVDRLSHRFQTHTHAMASEWTQWLDEALHGTSPVDGHDEEIDEESYDSAPRG